MLFSGSTISVLILTYVAGVPLVWSVVLVGLVDITMFVISSFKEVPTENRIITSSIITNTKEIDNLIMRQNQREEITARGLHQKIYGLTDYEKKYLPNN